MYMSYKKIIQHGNSYHETRCENCDCIFVFYNNHIFQDLVEIRDERTKTKTRSIYVSAVYCPECKCITHFGNEKYEKYKKHKWMYEK